MSNLRRVGFSVGMAVAIVAFAAGSNANLLIPNGGGSGDPKIEATGRQAAAAFFSGAARTYDMLSNVEVRKLNDARSFIGQARTAFQNAEKDCKSIKGPIVQSTKAVSALAARQVNVREISARYVAAGAIPAERLRRLDEVILLAGEGRLAALINLCEGAAETMLSALKTYETALGASGGPAQLESWRVMNRLEGELLTLRYAAILVEGPADPLKGGR